MGFFDSFKKKSEVNAVSPNLNNQGKRFDLPPPPLPKKSLSLENKKGPVFDLPPIPSAPVVPRFESMPSITSQTMPNQREVFPEKNKETFVLTPQNIKQSAQKEPSYNETKIEFKQKDYSLNIPDSLPEIPSLRAEHPILVNTKKDQYIPSFDIDIPEFEETPDLKKDFDALPVLEIFDSEEEIQRVNFRHSEIRKPLFIRTDYYSDILSTIDTMKSYVNESSEIIYGLENLKKNWDIEHRNYKNTLEDIQRKLIYIDKVLFEKEG